MLALARSLPQGGGRRSIRNCRELVTGSAKIRLLYNWGDTVTGQRYFALPKGPVVDKYEKRIVKQMTKAGWVTQLMDGKAKPLLVAKPFSTFDALTTDELQLAEQVSKRFETMTSTAASDLSHNNAGWILARSRHREGHAAVLIDLHVAMQELLDDDPWLNTPPDEALLKAMASAADATEPF